MRGIKKRVFIVGCSRSGTTLLQSCIASNDAVQTFPESHFFRVFKVKRLRKRLHLVNSLFIENYQNFMRKLDLRALPWWVGRFLPFRSLYFRSFISALDKVTLDADKSVWVEKTPMHLYSIKCIQRFVRDAVFIHIVRNGEDVVASLFEASNKYPEHWSGAKNLMKCIVRWNKDISVSARYLGQPQHVFVDYDELLRNEKKVTGDIFAVLGIVLEQQDDEGVMDKIIEPFEKWKRPPSLAGRKFDLLFDEHQKSVITAGLDQGEYNVIREFVGLV